MMLSRGYTDYHAKYWAEALSLTGSTGKLDRIAPALGNSRVDLNPHQIDAALFAIRSPLNKGVILADEVGLGKTIEAGLVISQRWAERRRNILLIMPATLRKQWQQELTDKFSIDSVILERNSFERYCRKGIKTPFAQIGAVKIVSYNFAMTKQSEIMAVTWDLVVIDEAYPPGEPIYAESA